MMGTVSWDAFLKCSDELLRISDKIDDGWTARGNKSTVGGYYLVKQVKRNCFVLGAPHETTDYLEDNELERYIEDVGSASHDNRERATEWDYHILYSISYSVPVLYFNACFSDGSLLTLEQLWLLLSGNFKGTLEHQKWNVLTQQEHPILRQPFFQLHPCKTAQFLESFKDSAWNILITWLSSVGPVVGLQLPLDYSNKRCPQ